MTVNANLCALHGSYLFSETAARVPRFRRKIRGKHCCGWASAM